MNFFVTFSSFLLICTVESGFIHDRGLGTDCLYDEDCITRNSFCKGNKICTCKIGYQYDAGSDVCFPKEVNLKCNEDYDCSALQNAKCINHICKCKDYYVSSSDKTTCLPSMRLTSICEEDSQCNSVMNGSLCDISIRRCICQKGYRKDSHRMQCLERQKLHTDCLKNEDCEWDEASKEKVECKRLGHWTRVCECREGFTEDDDNCISDGGSHAILSTSIIVLLMLKWINFLNR